MDIQLGVLDCCMYMPLKQQSAHVLEGNRARTSLTDALVS